MTSTEKTKVLAGGVAGSDGGEVEDKHRLALLYVYFVGLVILLPWNILITVSEYWDYKFRDTSLDGVDTDPDDPPPLTKYQKEFQSYLSIASNLPNALFLCLHALVGHRFDMKGRILYSQAGQVIVFVAIILLAALDSDDWQQTFLVLNLVTIVFINIFYAIFQGSFFALLGPFPVDYIGGCIVGTGMGGLLPSVMNVIILAISGDFQWAGFWTFVFAECMAVACLVWTVFMIRGNEFFIHHSNSLMKAKTENKEQAVVPKYTMRDFKKDLVLYKEIVEKAWIYLLSTTIIFTTTLAVFPAVCALVEPANPDDSDWSEVFFVPVCCFVVFNAGDVVGKWAAAWLQWPGPSLLGQWLVLLASVTRIALVPLIMLCNVAPGDRNTEIIFECDAYYLAFISILAVSNGYLGNLPSMFAPKVVKPEHSEVTAAFNVALLVVGCCLGSLVSTPVVRWL